MGAATASLLLKSSLRLPPTHAQRQTYQDQGMLTPSLSCLEEGWSCVGGIRLQDRASFGNPGAPAGPTCLPPARQGFNMWRGLHHLFPTPTPPALAVPPKSGV